MNPEKARQFARERVEALFNRGELDRVEELVTDDFVNHDAREGEEPGYLGFRLRLSRLRGAFPDFHMEVEDVLADRDLVAYRATATGTHCLLRRRDGKACEHWATRDDLSTLMQLGIVAPMGPTSA